VRNPSKKRCIFCLEEKPLSDFTEEHVFPYAIGGSFVIHDVCKDCNSYLGTAIDAKLTDHIFVQFPRHLLRIAGKDGRIPNPIGKGLYGGDPSRIMYYDFDLKGDNKDLYITPKIEVTEKGNELRVHIEAHEKDRESLPEIVNKILERRGLEPLDNDSIFDMIDTATEEHPSMTIQYQVGIYDHIQPMFKIAYELGYYWLGQDFLSDETARKIRETVLEREIDIERLESLKIRGNFSLTDEMELVDFWDDFPNYHFAILTGNADVIGIQLRVFDVFGGTIAISENAGKYGFSGNRFLVLNPEARIFREGTLEDFWDNWAV